MTLTAEKPGPSALSLVFSDGTATFNQVTRTDECGDFTVSATMTRE